MNRARSESRTRSGGEPVRLAIGDLRPVAADALAALFAGIDGFSVAFVSTGGRPAASTGREPDIVLVGVGVALAGALELALSLRERAPGALLVLLADALDTAMVRFALEHRVNGLLLSESSTHDIVDSLRQVARGHAVLPAGWQGVLADDEDAPLSSLSERQLDVLRLVAEGLSYDEIGTRLFISINTVKFHVRTIYLRLGVKNRVAAARLLAEQSGPVLHRARQDGNGGHPRVTYAPAPASPTTPAGRA